MIRLGTALKSQEDPYHRCLVISDPEVLACAYASYSARSSGVSLPSLHFSASFKQKKLESANE